MKFRGEDDNFGRSSKFKIKASSSLLQTGNFEQKESASSPSRGSSEGKKLLLLFGVDEFGEPAGDLLPRSLPVHAGHQKEDCASATRGGTWTST
mmetsp:Transcript_106799/g.189811  ORF Transcript_106799/g.189811 Transcript_106799/m.189811 type:complete len:94 (-) Transcript_106799:658-939(-)